jgi:dTDP-4-amino-4,6-dideoxygalactose transaminase
MPFIIAERKKVVDFYNSKLDFSKLRTITIRENTQWNYSYYPVVFQDETQLLAIIEKLAAIDVYPRRYFYPSLNTLEYCSGSVMPVSESISKTVLCLPLYVGLTSTELQQIIECINTNI